MKAKDFFRIVGIYKERFDEEYDYVEWLRKPVWNNFAKGVASAGDVEQIITFLYEWKMGRVVGKIRKRVGEENFLPLMIGGSKFLSRYSDRLGSYRFGLEFDVNLVKNEIRDVFKVLDESLKSTSALKLMHMTFPNLFIMWDNSIREGWGVTASSEAYISFLLRMQNEYRELVEDYAKEHSIAFDLGEEKLLRELNENMVDDILLTRWIDIYNWTKFTRLKERL